MMSNAGNSTMIIAPKTYRMLRCVLDGHTAGETAAQLGLSPATVSRRLRALYQHVPGLDFAVSVVRDVHRQQQVA